MEQPVGQAHDRAALGLLDEVVDGRNLLLVVDGRDHQLILGVNDVLDDLVHRVVDVVVALDRLVDLQGPGQHRLDEHAGVEAQVLERGDVERIGHGHDQRRAALDLDRHGDVLLRHVLLDQRQNCLVDHHVVQVHQREPKLLLEVLEHDLLCDGAEPDERRPEKLSGATLFGDRVGELLRRDQLLVEQNIAQTLVFLRHPSLRGAGEIGGIGPHHLSAASTPELTAI